MKFHNGMYWSQIKVFSFLFCITSNVKSTKGRKHLLYIEWLQNNKQKEFRLILCIYTQWKSTKRWRLLIHRMIRKQRVKAEQIKRKQICSACFANVQIPRKQVQDLSKEFLGNNNNNNKKTSWKSHQSKWSLHNKYGRSKAEDWR